MKKVKEKSYFLFLSLFLFGVLILISSVFQFLPKNSLEKTKILASRYPFLPIVHLRLTKNFFENGYLTSAQRELEVIKNSPFQMALTKLVPSWKKQYWQTVQLIEKRQRIENEIKLLEKTLSEKPYYLMGLLKASLLSYQIREDKKAQSFWQKAYWLDPNDEKVQKVGEVISRN